MKRLFSVSGASLPLGALALGGGALFYCCAVALAGGAGALVHFVLFLAAFVVCLLGCGLGCVRRLAPQLSGADALVAAFLPGCSCVFAGYAAICLLGSLFHFAPDGAGFLLLSFLPGAAAWWAILRKRRAARPPHGGTAFLLLALTIGAVLAVAAVWGVLPSAGADRLRAWTYNQDQLWSVGNAAAVRFGLPLQDMRVAGAPLYYYFFNDVLAGVLTLGTYGTAWAGVCWYWSFPLWSLGILGLYCVGRRLVPKAPWLAALVPAAMYFASPADSTLPTNLFTNANAQATALLALCGGLLLIQHTPKAPARRTGLQWLVLCLLSGVALTMLKGTVSMLLVLALGAALLVDLPLRQVRPAHALTLVGLAGGFALPYFLFLRLATNNLVFTSLASLKNLPAAYLRHFAVPVLLAYAAGLVYSAARLPRLGVPVLTLNAFALGGMLAYVLYNHYSYSQVYFALAALPCALLTLLPAGAALAERLAGPHRTIWRRAAAGALAVALCGCMAAELYTSRAYLRTGVQAAKRCLGGQAYEPAETRMTDGDWAAALWLREHTPTDTIFATNRNNKQFDAAEGTFHFYTAVSERRCYLESYRYGMDYDRSYYEIRRRLETVSDGMFYRMDETDALALAKTEGIDYLVVSLLVPGAPDWQTTPLYENADVRIYAVG